MFNDYLPANPTWLNCSFCLLLYLVMAVLSIRFKNPFFNRRVNIQVGWVLIFVFFIFSFYDDDWFAYFEHIKSVKYIIGNYNNVSNREALEPLYYIIIFALNGDYLLWRLVVFGTTVVLCYYIGKRLGINNASYFYAFALIAVPILSYARVSLAMAIAFFGLSFLIRPFHSLKFMSFLYGCVLIIISVFFHKSALVLPFFVLGAYFFKLNRKRVIILISLFMGFLYVLNTTDFMNQFLSEDNVQSLVSGRANKYLSIGMHWGIGHFIIKMMSWVSYYLFAYYSIILSSKKLVSKFVRPYAGAIIIIVFFSTMFLFTSGFSAFALFYRFIIFASIPIAVVTAYSIYNDVYRKAFAYATLLCVASRLLEILYSTYSSYILYD